MTLPEVLNLEFLCLTFDSGSDNDCLGHCGIGGVIVDTGGG
jgi:hypothetical protein